MRANGRMQPLVRFEEHTDEGAPVEKELKLLRDLIADRVAGLSIMGEQRHLHGVPSLESAGIPCVWKILC
jgi:hypothetical protein